MMMLHVVFIDKIQSYSTVQGVMRIVQNIVLHFKTKNVDQHKSYIYIVQHMNVCSMYSKFAKNKK